MTYNLSNLTASENFLDYSIAVNQLTGGMLFAIFLVLIGLVVYSRIEGTESQKAIASSFVCFIFAIVLNAVGILESFYVVLFLIILLMSSFSTLLSKFG